MRFWNRSLVSIVPILALVLFSFGLAAAADQPVPISERLEKALTADDFPWVAQDGTYTVWVFFQDKGVSGQALSQALDLAEADLSEKVAWRRAKVRATGERLVDEGDLKLHRPYREQVEATGAVLRRESRWLNAASFQATVQQIRQLAELGFVKKVDLVTRFQRPELPAESTQPQDALNKNNNRWDIDYGGNQAAMEQFNIPQVHDLGITGQGVVIGILDTGFRSAHESLVEIPLLAQYDFVNDDEIVDNEPGDPENSRDHGTMTMSTAMGNAPGSHVGPAFGASAILAKTEDVSQEIPIEEDQWVAGLEFVEAEGADIVSSSLGYTDWYEWSDMDGETAVTTIAADLGVERGLVVINSAGNERTNSWGHIIAPADGFNVLTVGAVTSSGSYSSFSSPGPSYDGRIKPDVAALGTSNHVADPSDDNGYRTASGTSFSCPLTSGVAALVLSRAPDLTPAQVRDALRETASMASSPNNDYGWGLIDALAAVTYFGPNFEHTPLTDTEDTTGPYTLGMMITDRLGLDESTALVWYRADGGPWQSTPIMATGGGPVSYYAQIPGQVGGTMVDYYLEASSVNGTTTRLPAQAPEAVFSFRVGQDMIPPQIAHNPLRDQAYIQWPPVLDCLVQDNLGIDRVEMTYQLNGGPVHGPFLMDAGTGDGNFSLEFPLSQAEVAIGDAIQYELVVFDSATIPNSMTTGVNSFEIIDTLGLVLVLDDGPPAVADIKYDDSRKDRPQLAPMTGKSASGSMANWLIEAGYVADIIPAAGVLIDDFANYDVVILSAGNNAQPVADSATRHTLQQWAAAGGKLIVEGGEVGYDAHNTPGYPDFAAQVLHTTHWDSDNGGDLLTAPSMENHPLLAYPHVLPYSVPVTYSSYGDQDAVEPAADAYPVMVPSSYQADGGIIVYDDNPAPQSAQILFWAFNIEAIDPVTGRQLTENALAYLLAEESAPTASITGQVNLAGQSDHSGVLVDIGSGLTVLTGVDGTYSFTDLYAGNYSVIASKEDWSVDRVDVELGDGQHLTDVDMTLYPIIQTSYEQYPALVIPDNLPSGVTTIITVPESEAGPIADLNMDVYIQHSWIGDLMVILTSPQGTSVVLHNRSGSQDDNILGNWPNSRPVDGPGSMDDFLGENNAGDWTLFLSDSVGSDEGVLTLWRLNFSLPDQVTSAPENNLPQITSLGANVPNPFNPMTEIRFDLAKTGKVQLDIYDLRGRLVSRLVDENLNAGRHTAVWKGTDRNGRSVSSGTYFYRLRAGDVVQNRKMLLVR